MSAALAAVTYTVLISFFIDLPVPGSVASAWARASGMYTLGGLPACGWVTMPMIVNLTLATVTVEPTFSLCAVA